jgi:PIN domain nuclease of toxin-antitoxin system
MEPVGLADIRQSCHAASEHFTAGGCIACASEMVAYEELPVSSEHAVCVETLPPVHKDPFDRILVAQAVAEPMRFVTHDQTLEQYGSPVFVV